MSFTLHHPLVRQVLDRLFEDANLQETLPLPIPPGFSFTSGSASSRCEAMAAAYMPISPRGGALLYTLARAVRPDRIVEFGTSFGISTIYLASAVADNRRGHVVTTELNAVKAKAAHENLLETGLREHVTILEGDALDTLRDIQAPVGFVLLDGWKDLLLPVLRLLEAKLSPGALVIADDSKQPAVSDYLAYVREPTNGYISVSFPVDDGMEISCRT